MKFKFINYLKNYILCKKYPFLQVKNVWSGKSIGYSFTVLDELEPGWRIAFGTQLCTDIAAALRKAGIPKRKWKSSIYWYDIKEKWGGLVLTATAPEEVQDVLSYYEDLSFCYCSECGKPARRITSGYIRYLCDDCANRLVELTGGELARRLTETDIPKHYNANGTLLEPSVKYKELWGLTHEK